MDSIVADVCQVASSSESAERIIISSGALETFVPFWNEYFPKQDVPKGFGYAIRRFLRNCLQVYPPLSTLWFPHMTVEHCLVHRPFGFLVRTFTYEGEAIRRYLVTDSAICFPSKKTLSENTESSLEISRVIFTDHALTRFKERFMPGQTVSREDAKNLAAFCLSASSEVVLDKVIKVHRIIKHGFVDVRYFVWGSVRFVLKKEFNQYLVLTIEPSQQQDI